jgi:formylglycine-generating enzyme required for sulfatase activity
MVPDKVTAMRPGQLFHDELAGGSAGPDMVVVPAGRFQMGSPVDEPNRKDNEGPRHAVTLNAFALGRTTVTRGDFSKFVRATGYKTDADLNTTPKVESPQDGCFVVGSVIGWKAGTSWRDPGYEQSDSHPVVCVSWNDAIAYVKWLSSETGSRYRLPSEAELEYAIRAGSDSPWPWGSDPDDGCSTSNGADVTAKAGFGRRFGLLMGLAFAASKCEDGFLFTAPVGRLRPNAFGLYDMVGNVYAWTQDCGHNDYQGAPTDGSPFHRPNCASHEIRGGSWSDEPPYLRSSARIAMRSLNRYHNVGLRLAREL